MNMDRLRNLITKRKKNKEDANTLVMYIMLFPVIFSAFGVSVDLAIGTYTNTNLQSALDTATQSSLSRAVNPGTNGNTLFSPSLTSDAAHQYITDFYDKNRTDISNDNENPFIRCQTTPIAGASLVTPPSGCAWSENSYNLGITGNVLQADVEIYEESSPVFLGMVGVDAIKYTITSSARTTYATN
jgi:hypothetical protein